MEFSYASLYAADGRARSSKSSTCKTIVLAPGRRVVRLGVGGCPVPCATISAHDIPLVPAGAAASSLLLAIAQYVGLTRSALSEHALVVAVPVVSFGPKQRHSLKRAALSVLNMPQVFFVDTHIAAAVVCRVDSVPHLVVDVGWESTRVLVRGMVVSAATVGLRDVNRALVEGGGKSNYDREHQLEENGDAVKLETCVLRAAACYFEECGDIEMTPPSRNENRGPLVDSNGAILVTADLRHAAPEALFCPNDPNRNVAAAVVEAIVGVSDLDLRAHMAQTILCLGGGAAIPGFHRRLEEAVRKDLGAFPRFQSLAGAVATVPPQQWTADILPWVGASLIGSMDSLRNDPTCCTVFENSLPSSTTTTQHSYTLEK